MDCAGPYFPLAMSTSVAFPVSPGLSSTVPQSPPCQHRRARSRTMSLLSIKSGTSERSLESPKAEPTVVEFNSFESHLACGSFVLSTSAITGLRSFLPPKHPRALRERFLTAREKQGEVTPSSSSATPFITRTLSLSSGSRSPSPPPGTLPRVRKRSRSRSRTRVRTRACSEIYPHDLHPTLADLEQRSKFCMKKSVCSTCDREGDGFPRCGKCGESWCCRECRLKGRKKHSCAMKCA